MMSRCGGSTLSSDMWPKGKGEHLVVGRGRKRNTPYTPYSALSQVSSFTLAMGSGTALRATGPKGQGPGSCREAEPGRWPWSPAGLPCAHLLRGRKRRWLVPECLAPSILCPGGKEAPWAVGPVPQRGLPLPELQELLPLSNLTASPCRRSSVWRG